MVESTVENICSYNCFFCKILIVCICSFHRCFGLLQLVVCDIFEEKMEGYGGDGGSQRESQEKWSQNSEWMQEMAAPIFIPHYSISEMLQRPSLLPSSFIAFFLPPPLIHHPPSTIGIGILEGKEEVLVGKKRAIQTKERSKKVRKADVIEIGKSDEEEMERVK